MSRQEKLVQKILQGRSDKNISFSSLRTLMKNFGFDERIRGDHHIFTKDGIEEILNMQPSNSKAKAYQVKQVRNIVLKYGLKTGD